MVHNFMRAILVSLGAAVGLPVSGLPEPANSSPHSLGRRFNGRLYRSAGVRHVYLCFGALSCIFFAAVFAPSVAVAQVTTTYQQALAQCQAWLVANDKGDTFSPVCNVYAQPANGQPGVISAYRQANNVWFGPSFAFSGTAPTFCAANAPQMTGNFAGRYLQGFSWCKPGVPTGSGSTTSCAMTFTPAPGGPVANQWGNWHTQGSMSPTGDTCDGSGTGSSVKDTSGNVANPAPPSPSTNPPVTPAPKTCGGGSCYDPSTDQYCATSGGQQSCVSGSDARSPAGACTSGAGATVCAGSPNAAQPPAANVPDPSTGLKGIDHYTQADPVSGGTQSVTTTVYNAPGSTPSTSGKSGSDSGPASASTSPSSACKPGDLCNDRYAGAACGVDPTVAGDPLLGAIAVDMHHVRCQADSQGLKASDFDGADRTLGDQTASPDQLFSDTSGDGSSGPIDSLDSTGFLGGGRACPGIPAVKFLGYDIVTDKGVCDVFGQFGAWVLAMAYASAAVIVYRGRAS